MSRRLWKTRFCLPTLFSAAVVLIAVSSISVLHNPVLALEILIFRLAVCVAYFHPIVPDHGVLRRVLPIRLLSPVDHPPRKSYHWQRCTMF